MSSRASLLVGLAVVAGCFGEAPTSGSTTTATTAGTSTGGSDGSTSSGSTSTATSSTTGTSSPTTTAESTGTESTTRDESTSIDPDTTTMGPPAPACPAEDQCPDCACMAGVGACMEEMNECMALPECIALFDCLLGGMSTDVCCPMFEMTPGVLQIYGDLRVCTNPLCGGPCSGGDVLPSC